MENNNMADGGRQRADGGGRTAEGRRQKANDEGMELDQVQRNFRVL